MTFILRSAERAPMSAAPAAVVFDCDGVLVDSEALSWGTWTDVLAEHGYAVTPEDEAASFGRRVADLHAHFAARTPLPPLERFEAALQPFADAVSLLEVLVAGGMRLAVASSSSVPRLERALAVTGLGTDRFEAVVSGDHVRHGKPAPDIYTRAATALDVPPDACWAVEDSPPGVASARAAGMRVIGVLRGHVEPADLADADLVVDRLDGPEVRAVLLGA